MLNFLRQKSADASKLFVAILLFSGLEKLHFIPGGHLAGGLAKIAIEAIVSSVVVTLVAEFVVGRPTIRLEWRTGHQDRPRTTEVSISAQKQAINLQMVASRETALQRILLNLSERRKFEIKIDLQPAGLLRLSRQGGTDTFQCNESTLVFEGIRLDSPGTIGTADFSVKKLNRSDYTTEVRVKVTGSWEPRLWRLPITLVSIEPSITRFVLEGSR